MFETLGHYRILDRIGAGGMGEVYRARDTRLGRTVAIKVLAATVAGDGERRERFLQEARATAALSHPNISALYEIGDEDGQLYLVFEFVPGETLTAAIAGRPLNPRRALDLSIQMADAIADAHAAGIVHRDIKPDNIIVTPKGHAKILDFGLATWTSGGIEREQAATVVATAAGTTLGTVAYMSPEQALGEAVDERTDIFSLGIVLFEMLTGRLPFKGATSTALALQIVQSAPPAPSSVNPSVPRELDPIVAKALAKSLDQRYESAATMAADLRAVAAILDVRSHRIQPPSSTVTILPRRRSYGRAIAVAALVAVAAAAAWYEREPIRAQWRRMFGRAPAPLIAVIPLELPENDASQLYFADGLTEDLISRLGQTPGLRVLGRSATRGYRNRQPRDVAQELGAGVVLTGSVRPSADNVRISLELIDPLDGTAIWSSQYTRDVQDIFKVQAQIAEEVATALRVKLQPSAASARTASRLVDPRAYELYLRGRQALAERKLPEAIKRYEQAIAADPGLAEAFAGLAEALYLNPTFDGVTDDSSPTARLKQAAARAYELDPDLPQANVAVALAADDLSEALKHLRRAVDADPSYAEGIHLIGDLIVDFEPQRAIAFYRRSLDLEPRMQVNYPDMALAFLLMNQLPAAVQAVVNAAPGTPWARLSRALIELERDRPEDAVATLRSDPELRTAASDWLTYATALRAAGRSDEAIGELRRLSGSFPRFCDAPSVLGGLLLERKDPAGARRLTSPLLERGQAAQAEPADVRCALLAAAATRDVAGVAAMLTRIAADERLLRRWAYGITGNVARLLLSPHSYPWSKVASDPVVAVGRQRLDAAYAREREVIGTALRGFP
jgi:non-specific serine/threonine protein kinase